MGDVPNGSDVPEVMPFIHIWVVDECHFVTSSPPQNDRRERKDVVMVM
jgi:hypothetical protein